MLQLLIFFGNSNRRIAEHGFRTGGRNMDKLSLFAFNRIFVIIHFADGFLLDNLQVGNGGHKLGIPVNQFLGLVNQSILIQVYENFADGAAQTLIHGKTLAAPVAGSPQAAQLPANGAAALFFPFPDGFNKFFAAKVMAGNAFFGQITLNNHLGCDTGVIHAGLPENLFAEHTVIANQNILQRVVQRVSHMQNAGNVRRRNDNGKSLLVLAHVGLEIAAVFPVGINLFFKVFRVVVFL